MTNPWNRRPTESDEAWLAFIHYRDLSLNERTVTNAVKAAGRKPANRRLFERWSSKHDWPTRAGAWDAHLDERRQRAMEETAEAIGRRQALLGRRLQEAAMKHLPSVGTGEHPPTGADVARLAKVGVELERLGVGLPTERTAVEGTPGKALEVRLVDVKPHEPEDEV